MNSYKRIVNLSWESVEPHLEGISQRGAAILTAFVRDKESISSIASRVGVSKERVGQVATTALAEIALLMLEKK